MRLQVPKVALPFGLVPFCSLLIRQRKRGPVVRQTLEIWLPFRWLARGAGDPANIFCPLEDFEFCGIDEALVFELRFFEVHTIAL
jgi:hypothetical protein